MSDRLNRLLAQPSTYRSRAEVTSFFDGLELVEPGVTAIHVGTSPADMEVIGQRTRHVLCRPAAAGGSGESSAPTAAGVLACITALRDRVFDGRPASALTFAIQGLGHVGGLIADSLAEQGASLVVADTDPGRRRLASRWHARVVGSGELLASEADILVPAALGGILTPQSVPALRCRAVAGPANNQLADDSVAGLLHAHGITWAPDPVVSAGGIVASVAREIDHLAEPEVQALLAAIGDRLGAILDESARSGLPPLTVTQQRIGTDSPKVPKQCRLGACGQHLADDNHPTLSDACGSSHT